MKFLINSKVLMEHIKMALQYNAYQITVTEDAVVFAALREISMPAVFIVHHEAFDIKFNRFRWQKVQNFIHDLPEQPLTVVLLDDTISISCEALFPV